MPEFIRVRFKDSGTEQSIAKPSTLDTTAYEVLDEPATDHNGRAIAPKFPEKKPTSEGPYSDLKVADLKVEIESRNAGRDEADQIPAKGNKSDLIAALTADDTKES